MNETIWQTIEIVLAIIIAGLVLFPVVTRSIWKEFESMNRSEQEQEK